MGDDGGANDLHGVFKGLLNGVHTRGEGGVLYVKGDLCAYRFPREFPGESIRDTLETILEEHGQQQFFVVDEKDGQLHVLAYPKERVWREALASAPPPPPSQEGECSTDASRVEELDDASWSEA